MEINTFSKDIICWYNDWVQTGPARDRNSSLKYCIWVPSSPKGLLPGGFSDGKMKLTAHPLRFSLCSALLSTEFTSTVHERKNFQGIQWYMRSHSFTSTGYFDLSICCASGKDTFHLLLKLNISICHENILSVNTEISIFVQKYLSLQLSNAAFPQRPTVER